MRLLTHNMLACNVKGVVNGYPLRLEAEIVAERAADFQADFLRHIFGRIDWKALVSAARSLPEEHRVVDLPEEADPSMLDSEEFLRRFHRALLEIHVEKGALVCPESGRRFPIDKGIPNMLLNEDEI
ncbi:multifunctional methyltransferase subunit TRM112 homolog A-like [Wolffia australiana]